MNTVNVYQVLDRWVLVSNVNGHVFNLHASTKLIDVIDVANQLHLVISNECELPLNQFEKLK